MTVLGCTTFAQHQKTTQPRLSAYKGKDTDTKILHNAMEMGDI